MSELFTCTRTFVELFRYLAAEDKASYHSLQSIADSLQTRNRHCTYSVESEHTTWQNAILIQVGMEEEETQRSKMSRRSSEMESHGVTW